MPDATIDDRMTKLEQLVGGMAETVNELSKSVVKMQANEDNDDKDKKVDDSEKDQESKNGTSETFSSDADREQYHQLQAENGQLKEQLEALKVGFDRLNSERTADQISAKILYFKREGVQLGTPEDEAELRKELLGLDDAGRERYYKRIEAHYARIPTGGGGIERGGMASAPDAPRIGGGSYADTKMMEAEALSAEKGIPLHEAMKQAV